MVNTMTLLRETRQLSSISRDSFSFGDFQQFIESWYVQRPGSNGLAEGRAPVPDVPSRSPPPC
jgi:hypothetical protein